MWLAKVGQLTDCPSSIVCRTFNCQFSKQASLEDNLGFLRDMLKELRRWVSSFQGNLLRWCY